MSRVTLYTCVTCLTCVSCYRCLLEQDPIAQRHMARINKYRGEYDRWGVTCHVSLVTCIMQVGQRTDQVLPQRAAPAGARAGHKGEQAAEEVRTIRDAFVTIKQFHDNTLV